MISKAFSFFRVLLLSLLLLMTMMGPASLYATTADDQSNQAASAAGSTQQPATDFRGTLIRHVLFEAFKCCALHDDGGH